MRPGNLPYLGNGGGPAHAKTASADACFPHCKYPQG